MAKKQDKPVRPKSNVVYLNVDLTPAYKADIAEWLKSQSDYWGLVEKVIDSGLRFGASFDAYNDCIQCTITKLPPNGTDEPTVVLVGRGPDFIKAFEALMFKFFVVLSSNLEQGDIKNARGVTDWS